jgi:hypothetical protein
MASWDDVRRVALALPAATEWLSGEGVRQWRVKDKLFVWERPLRRGDREALGGTAPDGPVLAVRVSDVGAKDAILADDPDVYFTTPHFNGYPAVPVWLNRIAASELTELVVEAWLVQAPKRLARDYLSQRKPDQPRSARHERRSPGGVPEGFGNDCRGRKLGWFVPPPDLAANSMPLVQVPRRTRCPRT